MNAHKILAALLAILPATVVSAQNCQPTLRQTTTYDAGVFCSTFTYHYQVCLPADCSEPIASVTLHFQGGVGMLDTSTVVAPTGWGTLVDHVNDVVTFSTILPTEFIYAGQCKSFEITTVCHPRNVEGLQLADFKGQFQVPIRSGVRAGYIAGLPYRSFLAGDPFARIGQPYSICAASPLDPQGQVFVLASPFLLQQPLQIPLIGQLSLDPILIAPLAPLPLDPLGAGHIQLPIPPDPSLTGLSLGLQALTLSPQAPRLSSPLQFTIR